MFTLRLTHHGDKLALAIFVGTGVVISVLNENLRRNAVREYGARALAEQARAEADAANRAKDFFLAAVSHDLRTPMNATLGWAHMLSRHILDHVQSDRAIEAIRRSVERQLVLVNDLLDTAAILSGRLRVEQAPVDLANLIGAAIEIAEPLAQAKRVSISVDSRGPKSDGSRRCISPAAGDVESVDERHQVHANGRSRTGAGLPRGSDGRDSGE